MDRSAFPTLTDQQFDTLGRMEAILGTEGIMALSAQEPVVQHKRIEKYVEYERALIAHIQKTVTPASPVVVQQVAAPERAPAPKTLKIKVNPFCGKVGENLLFWFREVETALHAGNIAEDHLQVAFAVSHLSERARDWALTHETSNREGFASWDHLKREMQIAFQPPNVAYRQRARFLSLKQGKKELHEYVEEVRLLIASMATNPLPEDVKITVFMEGLRVGPARTQLFRVSNDTLEEAIQAALTEEYSHNQAKHPLPYPSRSGGATPMELGTAESSGSTRKCFTCGSEDHMQRFCPRNAGTAPRGRGRGRGRGGRSSRGGRGGRGNDQGSAGQGNAQNQ
jgi:hypothetical protein